MTPIARTEGLHAERCPEGLVVTDVRAGTAVILGQVAASVWQHANGHRSVADLVTLVEQETELTVSESALWSTLDQLADQGLLAGRAAPPTAVIEPELGPTDLVNRRALLAKLGIAGGAVLAASVVKPLAAAAQQPATAQQQEQLAKQQARQQQEQRAKQQEQGAKQQQEQKLKKQRAHDQKKLDQQEEKAKKQEAHDTKKAMQQEQKLKKHEADAAG